jgi:hypothetical protein
VAHQKATDNLSGSKVHIKIDSVEAADRMSKLRPSIKYADYEISDLLRRAEGGLKLELELMHLNREISSAIAILKKREIPSQKICILQ